MNSLIQPSDLSLLQDYTSLGAQAMKKPKCNTGSGQHQKH